jgi:hypothetical protein
MEENDTKIFKCIVLLLVAFLTAITTNVWWGSASVCGDDKTRRDN